MVLLVRIIYMMVALVWGYHIGRVNGMKTSSAKAKGRRLQQKFREMLIEKLDIHPEDIESRSMGAGGEDLIMSRAARQKFPFSIERSQKRNKTL